MKAKVFLCFITSAVGAFIFLFSRGTTYAQYPQPDLIMQFINHSPASPNPGDPVSFIGRVQNIGTAIALSSITYFCFDELSDGSCNITLFSPTGFLLTGGFEDESWANVWTAVPGTHTYVICADVAGVVAESNEANNCSVGFVTVSAGPLPDLTVISTSINPVSPTAGNDINFTGEIQNIGAGDAPATTTRLRVDIGNDGSWDITQTRATPGINSGQTRSETFNNAWTNATVGTHRYEICTDTAGVVPESNETNNCTTPPVVFSVAAPNYTVSGTVFVDDTAPYDCSGSPPPYTLVATLTANRTGGIFLDDDTTDAVTGIYNLAFSGSPGNHYFVTISNIPGYILKTAQLDGAGFSSSDIAGPTYGPFELTPAGSKDNRTLDLCISNVIPWFQTTTGDVRRPSIQNKPPAGKVAADHASTPGLFIASNSNLDALDFNPGAVSSTGWLVSNEYSNNAHSRNNPGTVSYTFYMSQVNKFINSPPINFVDNYTGSINNLASGVYRINGNATINNYNHRIDLSAGIRVVILVDGDVTVQNDNITIPEGKNLFIVAAKRDIIIDDNMGNLDHSLEAAALPASTNVSIEGIYSAERDIILESTNNCGTERRLNVRGSLIANALNPFATGGAGDIVNNRSLCDDDAFFPTYKVYARYEFIPQLTDFYKPVFRRFSEEKP